MENKICIGNKVNEIVSQVILNDNWDLGAYGMSAGKLLLLAYWSEYTQDSKVKKYYENCLDECLNNLHSGYNHVPFYNGISGIFYCLYHLNNNNLSNIDLSDIDEFFDSYIEEHMFKLLEGKHYDLLYGGIGVGWYFLQKNSRSDLFKSILDHLNKIAIKKDDTWAWLSVIYEKPKLIVSLAHGMASIILFLSFTYAKGICQDQTRYLLQRAINLVKTQKISVSIYGCFYPNSSINEMGKSRLAWCYGDLGVALALWYAGKFLNDYELCNEAVAIFEYNAKRINLQDNFVFDSCFCHGTSGIAQIYRRMFFETGNPIFEKVADYWTIETLKMAKFPNGIAGYKFLNKTEMENDFSLLNGVTGVGLALLASIAPQSYSNWDSIFLLSNDLVNLPVSP